MPQIARITRRRMAWRLFWIGIAAAHLRATLGAWGVVGHGPTADADWTRIIVLSAVNLFFLLEIVFAPCLRFLSDRRAMVALLLVVVMLHAGVIQHAVPEFVLVRDLPLWASVTIAGAVVWRRILAMLRTSPSISTSPDANYATSQFRWIDIPPVVFPRNPLSGWLRAPLRAPPARAS